MHNIPVGGVRDVTLSSIAHEWLVWCCATVINVSLYFIVVFLTFQPAHNKTNKMACAPSEDSDQSQ